MTKAIMKAMLLFCAAVALPLAGNADEESSGQSKESLKSVLGVKKFEDSHVLTDNQLKADEGSLSRYSIKVSTSYNGAALSNLGAADQPNVDGTPGSYETKITGSISGRYRLSSTEALSAGTGISAIHPLHGLERFDTNSPYIGYDLSSRISDIQMRNSLSASIVTVPAFLATGETHTVGFGNSLVYDLGRSGFALSLESRLEYFLYNRGWVPKDGKAPNYYLSFYPGVKYNVTGKFSVNTSLSLMSFNPRSESDVTTLRTRTTSQRLGVGYALSRDIYLSPYLTFYPGRLAMDTTTFSLSSIFSIL
jgi:hypothetical protein